MPSLAGEVGRHDGAEMEMIAVFLARGIKACVAERARCLAFHDAQIARQTGVECQHDLAVVDVGELLREIEMCDQSSRVHTGIRATRAFDDGAKIPEIGAGLGEDTAHRARAGAALPAFKIRAIVGDGEEQSTRFHIAICSVGERD